MKYFKLKKEDITLHRNIIQLFLNRATLILFLFGNPHGANTAYTKFTCHVASTFFANNVLLISTAELVSTLTKMHMREVTLPSKAHGSSATCLLLAGLIQADNEERIRNNMLHGRLAFAPCGIINAWWVPTFQEPPLCHRLQRRRLLTGTCSQQSPISASTPGTASGAPNQTISSINQVVRTMRSVHYLFSALSIQPFALER